jgi:hypothetical protein
MMILLDFVGIFIVELGGNGNVDLFVEDVGKVYVICD